MNTELNKSAYCYIGYIEKNPVCFLAVLHFPHPSSKNLKRGHRLVVLPDYQGLGIGHAFSTDIAQMYKDSGFRFISTSSVRGLYKKRSSDKRWAVTRKGRNVTNSKTAICSLKKTMTQNKITYSYEYIG